MPADEHLPGAHYGAEVPPAVPQTSPRACTICIDLPRTRRAEEGSRDVFGSLEPPTSYAVTHYQKGLRSHYRSPYASTYTLHSSNLDPSAPEIAANSTRIEHVSTSSRR